MSITSAMYTGISGLNANGEAISVLGNNISNTNTVGFKSGRMLFSDVLSSSIGNNSQIGRGVQIQTVQNNFSQGSFESTENVTDLALQGDAFFIVKNPGEAQRYTRAGAFSFDKSKILVNPDGQQVQGYGINQTTGLNNGVVGQINLTEFSTQAPKMTSAITTRLNLDSTAAAFTNDNTENATLSPTFNTSGVPATTSGQFSVFDSDGVAHTVEITFTLNTPYVPASGATPATGSKWDYQAFVDGAEDGSPFTGQLVFDALGVATNTYGTVSPADITFQLASGTPGTPTANPIAINFSGATEGSALTTAVGAATADGSGFDPLNQVATSNYSNSTTMYDAQGNPHTMTTYYRKTGVNAWEWHAQTPDAVSGGLIDGKFAFGANGILTSQNPAATAAQNISFTGVTAPQPVTFDFGVNSTTQFASASVVNTQSQNGYYQGSLSKIQVDESGYVVGVYSNGQSQKIAQVALARFASTAGLLKAGGTLYEETLASGQALISDASTPGVGTVLSNSLEQSNVDMAAQFVKLIQAQRAFSANSKTITTSDEMTQEVLNLKR